MIYLDNAATTFPKPESVIKAGVYAAKYGASPGRAGHRLSLKAADIVYRTREKAARLFNCNPEQVCFLKNCTEALNTAIKAQSGHIICSPLEHNSVLRPLYFRGNFSIFEKHPKEVLRKDTAALVCTAASNVTAHAYDIKEMSDFCRNNGLVFILDAAQMAGVKNIDSSLCDYVCIASHKGLYAPVGSGMLICKNPPKQALIQGGTGSFSADYSQPPFLPDMLESGTLNTFSIAGTGAGIDFIKGKAVYEHEIALCEILYGALKNMKKVSIISERPKLHQTAPIVSFNIKGFHSEQVADMLSRSGIAVRGGLHCAPLAHKRCGTLESGAVRVSPSVFNRITDIKAVIDEVYKIISN
ncbi:MAG: aminotransferase class V-fold PLP-dependent enzyme [Oscillospiraceae bacterium]|nr:aminotransferase class V-fold PLP-dependent enzyme [Candidatus Equicaccousia limihippi]